MKTTLDLPDDLLTEVKLHAVHAGKKLRVVFAELLREGLDAATGTPANGVSVDSAALKRRRLMTRKFVADKWGVQLADFEQAAQADRRADQRRSKAWRG